MAALSARKSSTIFTTLMTLGLTASYGVAADYHYADVEKKLQADYALTVVNAEGGVVTQGVVLVLKKGLVAGTDFHCISEYKDGTVTLTKSGNTGCNQTAKKILGIANKIPGLNNTTSQAGNGAQTTRAFVMGEKMYVTKIEVKEYISFSLVSDAINDATYKAEVHFPIAKGTTPTPEDAKKMVEEMFSIAPADNSQGGGQQQAQAASAAPQAAEAAPAPIPAPAPPPDQPALAPIAPPPPPPDQPAAPPPTVALGMTTGQVTAILGQPTRVASLGSKEIYSYPNLKVTFVNGKVTDVQ